MLATKPHYPILDGLRGVAALMVVAFHIFETHATSRHDLIINHGYLAVDFFFLLSGFVIGYAYDDRWSTMTVRDFFKRRLLRLQPMVVMGTMIGALFFYFQASASFPLISQTPVWKMLFVMLLGFLMLPITPAMDIRGWRETYPLNGPAWSLFFEFVVNIFYGIAFRRLSKKALALLVFVSGVALVHFAVTSRHGDVIGGWTLEPQQLRVGFTRLMFPFFAGLLLFRVARLRQVKNAFLWSSLLVVVVLGMPRIGGKEHVWINGLYDSLSIILVFPLIIYIGASGAVTNSYAKKLCRFLGDISYPIYITHYPLIYTYTAWVHGNKIPLKDAYPVGIVIFLAAIVLAYVCLKFYDEPVRLWLKKKAVGANLQQRENDVPVVLK